MNPLQKKERCDLWPPSPVQRRFCIPNFQSGLYSSRLINGNVIDLCLSPCDKKANLSLRPEEMAGGARTIVVGGVRNSVGTSSLRVVDSTGPVTTDGDVDDN